MAAFSHLICLFSSAALMSLAPAAASQFHAVIVADTDSDLSAEVKQSIALVEQSAKKSARALRAPYCPHILTGKEATPERVLETVSQLDAGDDYLLFYYAGHGFRGALKESPWPNLYFTRVDEALQLETVVDLAAQKGARAAVVIADCCNARHFIDPDEIEPPALDFNHLPLKPHHLDQSQLFAENSGVLVLASCSPGERAWIIQQGGLFTLYLFDSGWGKTDSPDWAQQWDAIGLALQGIQTPLWGSA